MRITALWLGILLVAGCSTPPPPPATPMTYQTINAQSNHEKQVSLEGYPRLPSMTMVSDTINLEIHEKPDGQGAKSHFKPKLGSGKNNCERPPKDYKDTDLKLHANDGTVVGINDKIRVAGKAHWSKTTKGEDFVILMAPIDIQKL